VQGDGHARRDHDDDQNRMKVILGSNLVSSGSNKCNGDKEESFKADCVDDEEEDADIERSILQSRIHR